MASSTAWKSDDRRPGWRRAGGVRAGAAATAVALLAGLAHGHAPEAMVVQPAAPVAAAVLPVPAIARLGLPEDKATAELKAASAAKRAADKLEKSAKDEALAAVVESYRAIMERPGVTAAGRAEAAFRAGEIERARKRNEECEAFFRRAVELGGEAAAEADGAGQARDFASRALLERAHLRRRAKDTDGALALYAEVRERFGDRRRSAAHARSWSGKLHLAAGRMEAAAADLGGFLQAYPEYPAEAVRDVDLLAVELFESGDEDGARRAVDELRAGIAGVLEAGGRTAEAVRRALEAMKVLDLLAGD